MRESSDSHRLVHPTPAKRNVLVLAALLAVDARAAAPAPRNGDTATMVPAPVTRAAAAPVHRHNTLDNCNEDMRLTLTGFVKIISSKKTFDG